ncbi:MAG: OapC/ArvC family zinc-ribbon domain-containing protein [Halobacteria archaeon]
MPHECVDCGEVFEDGSDEVFEGCPSCGGTKFFYVKQVGGSEADGSGSNGSADGVGNPSGDEHAPDEAEPVPPTQTGSGDDRDIVEADSDYERAFGGRLGDEDADSDAQDGDEIRDVSDTDDTTFRRARAEEARDELMDQFETIRIVEPGSYELNLMNLYDSDEKIIALQEDGRYQVSLPSTIDD